MIRFFLSALLFAVLSTPARSQDIGRVSPASVPLPLPTAAPMPPDQLRAHNPWNLPMTGTWRFQLTHGKIVSNQFVSADAAAGPVTASSNEEANPPENAFDGKSDTRWCADGSDYPQWLQADLGQVRHVTGIALTWEYDTEHYRCRIEGSLDRKQWTTLADETAAPGIGNGPISLTPGDARYVRVFITGTSGGHWASLRECQIRIAEGGQEIAWQPPAPQPLVVTASDDSFAGPGFDDHGWDAVPVPSNWEMLGYSIPTYNSVDNTVGLYRRRVTVPASWAGKRIYWRFDGALDGAEVFVNGQKAGYHESGYTAFDIDLTGLAKPGKENLFAVRVSKTTPSDDCETGDFQAMGGIYRDTSLIAVPETHIHDITVRTPLAANDRDATLAATVQVMGTPGAAITVLGKLVGSDGHPTTVRVAGQGNIGADGTAAIALSAPVTAPALWSAEKPNLYYLVLQLTRGGKPVERAEQRFGFRQVEIRNHIVLWNGRPIKCTGVCRHDFWADKGFALTDTQWLKDLNLMKAANINAIRTSHYNHAARFLELCDEKGMYILDEVPFCWIGNKVKDPAFLPPLMQRTVETLARDKNRACVLAWSIGNENGFGQDEQALMDTVKRTDPTRLAFVSQMNPSVIKGQDLNDAHYPKPDSVNWDATHNAAIETTNYSEQPHIFYQKEAQDYDPGVSDLWSEALAKNWEMLWKAPTILGSFIWEWQNQGIADKNPNQTRDFYYGPDRLRDENNKGVVSAYRVPKPEWWTVKMVYSPVVIGTRTVSPNHRTCVVPLTNHYSFTDLSELSCRWTALHGTTVLKRGVMHVACAPMQSTQAAFPAFAGMTALRLEFDHADGTSVVAANLPVAGSALPTPPAAMTEGNALTTQDGPDTLTVSNALEQFAFDKRTGSVRSWRVGGHDLLVGGPIVNLGEAKTGNVKSYYQAAQPPVLSSAQVIASSQAANGAVRVTVTGSVLTAAGGSPLGMLTCTYDIQPDAEMTVHWQINWTASDENLWEEGLKLSLPAGLTQMRWQRDAFFADYPAGHLGAPSGTCAADDVSFRASKRGLHWLTLTDPAGVGLALLTTDLPLVARANADASGTTLFASREVAGPQDLSGDWVADHDIHAVKGSPLIGAFTLRAVSLRP